ncbi:MAG: hypothetical protein QOE73_648 [Verrucomicrobiota bacterium]|jgi:hypothetical protein
MRPSREFIKFGAICGLLTALTTLAVHWLPELWAGVNTFEERLQLRNNPIYMGRLWVVLIHCVLVVISMAALGVLKWRDAPALAGFGFLGFVFFALFEMLRTAFAIFAMNRTWRAGYAAAVDPATQQSLRGIIGAFSGINDALFFLFDAAFVLGLLCYGLALIRGEGFDRKLGFLFLFWFVVSLPAVLDAIRGGDSVSKWFGWVGLYFLPMARAITGIWLWQKSNLLERTA